MKHYLILILFSTILFSSCGKKVKKELLQKQKDYSELEQKYQEVESKYAILLEQGYQAEGVFFEVQIEAFEEFDMDKYMEDYMRLMQIDHESMKKFVLGRFRKEKEAEAFLRDVKKNLHIEDAFIYGNIDGRRVSLKEARKEAKARYGG